MDLAISASSYDTLSQTQSLASRTVSSVQTANAPKPEANPPPARQQGNVALQANKQSQATQQQASDQTHATTNFTFEERTHVMKVSDKDVLIYQVPPKGVLQVIKAQIQEGINVQASA